MQGNEDFKCSAWCTGNSVFWCAGEIECSLVEAICRYDVIQRRLLKVPGMSGLLRVE
ncbi:hypothetical protein Pan258_09490 [Symmachiella dynata]|nr:hypothetical protein Pan258_09490 [Symmachiella dynata]